MRNILCHYYGPAKLTYGLKSVQWCDSSKNMVTFLKKHNQKVSVCTIVVNAEWLRFTHHLPWQDHLLNLALKANSIPLDLTHISHHCHFFQWLSPLQVQTTDNLAIISGYILRLKCIIITSHQPRKFHMSSCLMKFSPTFTPSILICTCPCTGLQNVREGERRIVNHNTRARAVSRRYFTANSRARS